MTSSDASSFDAHVPVLLQPTLDGLDISREGVYVDATFGRGGHSKAILDGLSSHGRLLAFDRDPQAVETAKQLQADDSRFDIIHAPFSDMYEALTQKKLAGKINGILMDLGVSSPQLDDAQRGFSFLQDGPLDMRMDPTSGISAAEWLQHAEESDIAKVLKEFGEERFGKRIANAIVNTRLEQPILRTHQLVDIICQALPVKDKHKHPATRSFQGIRIFINGEFDQLEAGLDNAINCLAPGGRLAVISFHSLEDRMVKRYFKRLSQGESLPRGLPVTEQELDAQRVIKIIGKAVKADEDELQVNIRARSAVLRVAEKR